MSHLLQSDEDLAATTAYRNHKTAVKAGKPGLRLLQYFAAQTGNPALMLEAAQLAEGYTAKQQDHAIQLFWQQMDAHNSSPSALAAEALLRIAQSAGRPGLITRAEAISWQYCVSQPDEKAA